MEFAETGHWREGCPDLPVSSLIVLHALRLECKKSMELTASSHRSCFSCSQPLSESILLEFLLDTKLESESLGL